MPLGTEVLGLGPGDFVLNEDPATRRKRAHPPHPILADVYCGQTAGRIKMPLGMEVGLGPGHIVLDGDPAPPQQHLPTFGPCLLWPNGRPSQQLLSSCYGRPM